MRPALVLSLAGSFAVLLAGFFAGGCSGTRSTASTPVAASHAPAARALADPAVAASKPTSHPPPPRNPRTLFPRSRAIPPPPGAPIDGWSREAWNGIEPLVLDRDDTVVLDRALRLTPFVGLSSKKSDFWSPCVRDFMQTQPDAARDVLGDALSLYSTVCSGGPSWRVEFQTPRADRTAPVQSYLGLVGALERTSCELALRAAYHGHPVHAERITLIADGVRWSSTRIDFEDDDGWEVATLPLTRELARVVKRAADARDTLLRFEADRGYEDVVVTDDMKQDLRVMLDALDAINRP